MTHSGKHSLRRASLALIVGVALALLFTHGRTRQGPISLPPAGRHAPVPAGRARITKIVDGDTVHVLMAAEGGAAPEEVKVRLFGINAPELHPRPGTRKEDFTVEPCAQEAADLLASLCPEDSVVEITTFGPDKYGRTLAVLRTANGRDVNRALLEAGLAKAYFLGGSKKDPLRLDYERAEGKARDAGLGIWK